MQGGEVTMTDSELSSCHLGMLVDKVGWQHCTSFSKEVAR